MKFLVLILKSTIRNPRRCILTIFSIASSFFLMSSLRTLQITLEDPSNSPQAALRLIVRHRVSIMMVMPVQYRDRILKVPGVEKVVAGRFFLGTYKDPSVFFGQAALEPFFDLYPDLTVAPEHQQAFREDRTAAIVGTELARRLGWKIGDRVTLISKSSGLKVETTVRGFISGMGAQNAFYFRWDYLNELTGSPNFAGLFMIKARSAGEIPSIIENVDAMFENSGDPTRTETEKSFVLEIAQMWGSVRGIVLSIVSVLLFTLVLVLANTMGMSLRERTLEIAVMKTLGFTPRRIVVMVLCEALLLSLAGAGLGSLAAWYAFKAIDVTSISMAPLPRMNVSPETIALTLSISILVAAISATIPAWSYSRLPIVDSIRRRGE